MVHLKTSLALASALLGATPALGGVMRRVDVVAAGGSSPRESLASVLQDTTKTSCLLKVFRRLQSQKGLGSYDDVAGIHGFSLDSGIWPGDTIKTGVRDPAGYCPHSNVLFATWHRPYLIYFEKLCFDIAQTECSGQGFRLPYWDWAADTRLPDIFTSQRWPIDGTDSDNPLFRYNFPNGAPLNVNKPTVRGGGVSDDAEGQAAANVAALGVQMRTTVYTTLTRNDTNYMDFSNKIIDNQAGGDGTPGYDSLETIHDRIHVAVGGAAGTMTFTTSSAFDPTFWFHHCQVDRLLAIWEALHPGKTINDAVTNGGSISLVPFPNGGRYFNSDDVSDTTAWGYHYEDAQGDVLANVNRLYPQTATTSTSAARTNKRSEDCDKSKPQGGDAKDKTGPSSHSGGQSKPNYDRHRLATWPTPEDYDTHRSKVVNAKGQYMDYTCNVKVNSDAFEGSFKILFYIGDSCKKDGWKPDGTKYYEADDYVGYYTSFGFAKGDGMKMNKIFGGTVSLTNACVNLVTQGVIPDTTQKTVEAHLKEHMCFKVVGQDGKEIDPKTVKDLGISVIGGEVTLPATEKDWPVYGTSKLIYTLH